MNKEVIVYTLPQCAGCFATTKWLDKKGIEYSTIEITQEIAAEKNIKEAPYVEIIEHSPSGGSLKDSWTKFRIDRLGGLLL